MFNIEGWNWAIWVWVALLVVGVLLSANKHGQPRKGINNFWVDLFAFGLTCTLFYFGGFFRGF